MEASSMIKGHLLSEAGRELLIKVVGQSIHIYAMQCFLLPKYFCDDLNKMVTRFWWNGTDYPRKLYWLS